MHAWKVEKSEMLDDEKNENLEPLPPPMNMSSRPRSRSLKLPQSTPNPILGIITPLTWYHGPFMACTRMFPPVQFFHLRRMPSEYDFIYHKKDEE